MYLQTRKHLIWQFLTSLTPFIDGILLNESKDKYMCTAFRFVNKNIQKHVICFLCDIFVPISGIKEKEGKVKEEVQFLL